MLVGSDRPISSIVHAKQETQALPEKVGPRLVAQTRSLDLTINKLIEALYYE